MNYTYVLTTCRVISPVTTSSQKKYYLGCRLPQDYPNSPPVLYVMHPNPLPGVTELSHEHHTRNKHPEFGYTHVCHYRKWGPEKSIYLVLMKGRLWLEAYDAYMAGKGKIDEFLKTGTHICIN